MTVNILPRKKQVSHEYCLVKRCDSHSEQISFFCLLQIRVQCATRIDLCDPGLAELL
jgi:hypothetical protein